MYTIFLCPIRKGTVIDKISNLFKTFFVKLKTTTVVDNLNFQDML